MSREEEIRAELFEHTLNGHAPEVKALTEEGLKLGMDPMNILFKALIPSLEEVGRRFEKGDFFVPEMLIAARAMQGALVILRPLIAETGAQPVGRYVIGTVKGDIHDIGKNIVSMLLEAHGFAVVDLGVDVSPERIAQTVDEVRPEILGLSCLLTSGLESMAKTVIAMRARTATWDRRLPIVIGGAPIDRTACEETGADGWCSDAVNGIAVVESLVGN